MTPAHCNTELVVALQSIQTLVSMMEEEHASMDNQWPHTNDNGKSASILKIIPCFLGFGDAYDHVDRFKQICRAYKAFTLVPKDDHWKLEPRSRKYIFLGYGLEGKFGYKLWDLENRQIVWSLDIVFNELEMHKAAKRPIEVWRVNFSDVLSSPYGPTQHTRVATGQAVSTGTRWLREQSK